VKTANAMCKGSVGNVTVTTLYCCMFRLKTDVGLSHSSQEGLLHREDLAIFKLHPSPFSTISQIWRLESQT